MLGKDLDSGLLCHTSRDQEWAALLGLGAQAGPRPVVARLYKGKFGSFILRQRHFSCPAIFSMREGMAFSLILFLGSQVGRGGKCAASQGETEGQPQGKERVGSLA